MLHIMMILGWLAFNGCVALGVAIAADRVLGTCSTPRPTRAAGTLVRAHVSLDGRGERPTQKEKTDV